MVCAQANAVVRQGCTRDCVHVLKRPRTCRATPLLTAPLTYSGAKKSKNPQNGSVCHPQEISAPQRGRPAAKASLLPPSLALFFLRRTPRR